MNRARMKAVAVTSSVVGLAIFCGGFAAGERYSERALLPPKIERALELQRREQRLDPWDQETPGGDPRDCWLLGLRELDDREGLLRMLERDYPRPPASNCVLRAIGLYGDPTLIGAMLDHLQTVPIRDVPRSAATISAALIDLGSDQARQRAAELVRSADWRLRLVGVDVLAELGTAADRSAVLAMYEDEVGVVWGRAALALRRWRVRAEQCEPLGCVDGSWERGAPVPILPPEVPPPTLPPPPSVVLPPNPAQPDAPAASPD
ncbi:MAG: hypothetical protein H6744_19900 [Deltaproteobacteria bacterium]|nr:hypothetical protein [Deltaproteobacteria bacterium]MCB9788947.1 hypothetical protein [Deltaproteobacteria bacterium]